MLIRNINVNSGVCNGTRLIILMEKTVLIPGMALILSDTELPFDFQRFPISQPFCMTINKSQGQT